MTGRLLALVALVSFTLVFPMAAETDGKAVYAKNCATCHGPDGKGNERITKMLNIDISKLDIANSATAKKPIAEVIKTVHDGGGKMKPFKDKLSADEIAAVVKYVRSLKK